MDGEVGTALGKGESHDVLRKRTDRGGWARHIRSTAEAQPGLFAAASLLALATASAWLHATFAGWAHGPFVFMDELGYERMAQSFAHTGHFSLFGKSGLAYSPLYPIVLSPIYRLTSSTQSAYDWAKTLNAVLISLAAFPTYAIARSVLSRGRSVGVAALSLLAPLLLYSSFEMSESLAYPLCLVAIWAMLRAVQRPTLANDGLMLGAIGLACTARLQFLALLPAALTAIILVALLPQPSRGMTRRHAVLRAVLQHRALFGVSAGGLFATLVRWAMNGGNLPLAGRYANVGTSHASPARVVELFFEHLAELDFAVGVIPFAAALLAGYALVRFRFPPRATVFASVALGATFWLLLETAYDAAAFDAFGARPGHGSGVVDLSALHERYLIYLVPLFLVALVASLPLFRAKAIPASRHLVIAAGAAALPALIPFGNVINTGSAVDTFALQAFAKVTSGTITPAPHATVVAVGVSALLAFGYVRSAAAPVPSLAVSMTVLALVAMSALELGRQTIAVAGTGRNASRTNWIDRTIAGRGQVSLVGGGRVQPAELDQTAFWNRSISRVYYTCSVAFGADFGEEALTLDRANGQLKSAAGPLRARYAVVPTAFRVPGRVLARDKGSRLVLIAPSGGVLRIPVRARPSLSCAG